VKEANMQSLQTIDSNDMSLGKDKTTKTCGGPMVARG
jgi:hypothetical protein